MWVVKHEEDKLGDILTWLKPNKPYLIGRNEEEVQFSFKSPKVSRQLLELKIEKKTITIKLLSRSKVLINGDIHKLSKNQPPQTIQFQKDIKIEVPDSKEDQPILLTYHALNIYDNKNPMISQLDSLSLDYELSRSSSSFFMFNGIDDDCRKAVMLGNPILDQSWIDSIETHSIEKWFLNIDYKDYLPNGDPNYLPKNRYDLFNNVNLVSLVHLNWIDIELNSLDKSGDRFILVNDSDVEGYKSIPGDQLWQAVFNNDISTLPINTRKKRHREEQDISPRKRKRYTKVNDKLHFFSIGKQGESTQESPQKNQDSFTLEDSTNQVNATPESFQIQSESLQIPQQKDHDSRAETHSTSPREDSIPQEKSSKQVNATPESALLPSHNGNTSQHVTHTSVSPVIPAKRKPENNSITHTNPKARKFVPKKSFVDAVIQAKEENESQWNKELGIGDEDDSQHKIEQNLSNLAIVEIVDFKLRTPLNTQAKPNKHSTKKNFKTFKKNLPLNRSKKLIGSETYDFNERPMKNKFKDKTLDSEFHGMMNDVRGFEPEPLFVDDDSEDEDSFNKSRTASLPRTKPSYTPNNDENDDYDEDDDDDDQPKFGFTR